MNANVPPSPSPLQRLVVPLGLAIAAALFVLGTAIVFRPYLAEYLIAEFFSEAGIKDVSLAVDRVGLDGLVIQDLAAENGALRIAKIEAMFNLRDLLRSRLEALSVSGVSAIITWDESGWRMGEFRPDPNGGPLNLPEIGKFRGERMILVVDTAAARFRAPLTIAAEAMPNGWNADVAGTLEGPGATVALEWSGLLTPADFSQSAGQGRFDLAVDDLLVPGSGQRLDARGRITVDAKEGLFAVRIAEPLTITTSSPAESLLGGLPWTITIAPSQSEAALILAADGDRRSARFDIAAAGRSGDGQMNLALVGDAVRSPQGTAFKLARAHTELQRLPFAGGAVSGHLTVSNFAGDPAFAKGRLEASFDISGVKFAKAKLDDARASLESDISLKDGALRLELESLRALLTRGAIGDWILSAPAELSLKPGAKQTSNITIGRFGLGNSAELAVAVPNLALRNAGKEGDHILLRAPDLRLTATSKALSLDARLSASDLSFTHPAADVRSGRLDIKIGSGDASGSASARLVRVGPGAVPAVAASALVTSAALSTRGDELAVNGTFSTAAGTKLADYTLQFSPDFERGSGSLTMPKTKFERGGKVDAADLAFLTAVSDLTGTIGLDIKRSWNQKETTETATAIFEDVSFAFGDVSVAGLTTTLDLTGLAPPMSTPAQQLQAMSVTAGPPLTSLKASYALPGDGTLLIREAAADVGGGEIKLLDAILPLDGRPGAFSIGVSRIDMAQLVAQAKVDGLSVTGTLTGAIPLRTDETGYHIAEGVLRADGPGRLIYAPSTPPAALADNQGGALLLQALSNFAYDRLSITINGPVTDEISLLIAIAGKNPAVYGGYPIEFNLNLSGKLTQIMRQGLVGVGVPADLERQLRERRPLGP